LKEFGDTPRGGRAAASQLVSILPLLQKSPDYENRPSKVLSKFVFLPFLQYHIVSIEFLEMPVKFIVS